MSNQQVIFNLIKAVSGQSNILTIPRVFIDIAGDLESALFLSQCVYWSDKSSASDGWFYKTHNEWEQEIGLSYFQVKRVVKKLGRFIETKIKRANAAPTVHYRVKLDELTNAILEKLDIRETLNSNLSNVDVEETPKSEVQETPKTLTETTAKTTTKSKRDKSRAPDPRSKHPAIQLVHGVTGQYPPKASYDLLIARLGETPDGPKFSRVHTTWVTRGNKPTNLEGQLDWYDNGIPEYKPAFQQQQPKKQTATDMGYQNAARSR